MHPQVESSLRTIFRRCVQCPDVTPSCPQCGEGEKCSLTTKSCNACSSTTCIKVGSSADSSDAQVSKSGGTNAGAIAGGVIGAIAIIVIMTLIVWRCCIKKRRQQYADEPWDNENREKSRDFAAKRADRASTHTVQSIASTVISRASNIIHIAYIPGVTNRSPNSTPGLLVPPVPPLPFGSTTTSAASSPNYHQDQHFFMPDLGDRNSTATAQTDHRTTMARESITPSLARQSVASTVYGNASVVDRRPAQQFIRGKAAVVSVKSSGPNSPTGSRSTTPPLPSFDAEKLKQKGVLAVPASQQNQNDAASIRPPPSPAFSVGSTFLDSKADTAKAVTARPVTVKKPSKQSLSAENKASRNASNATEKSRNTSGEMSGAGGATSVAEKHHTLGSPITVIHDTPAFEQSPFGDSAAATPTSVVPAPPSSPPPRNPAREGGSDNSGNGSDSASTPRTRENAHSRGESLSAVIQEATLRAMQQPRHGGFGSSDMGVLPNPPAPTQPSSSRQGSRPSLAEQRTDSGPFSDSNAVRDEHS